MDPTAIEDLVEEREELFWSKNPCFNSIDGSEAINLRENRSNSSPDLKALNLSVSFHGWRFPNAKFKSWARKMATLHETTWRKAGILEAIMVSTYRIYRNPDLVLGIAEKWCPDTNTFVFSWGETTITLEDVMVLLDFSVLGFPVFATLDSSEKKDSLRNLEREWVKIKKEKQRVTQVEWMSRFMGSGDELEHVAFLALWLSYFVFPSRYYHISETVFPIAVHLSSGTKIAIAPAVLAHLYSELTLLKTHIRPITKSPVKIDLGSLFKLLQVWTWERFRNLRPIAKEILKGEPRISRWQDLKQKFENVSMGFDLDDFDWRPYTMPLHNWNPLRFYVEEAMWITTDNSLVDNKFVSFARCVKSSHLVGIGYVEDYYPNRVAMQFGSAQDLPGLVNYQRNFTEKEAWDDYNKSLDGLKLYIPSRLAQGSVTARYRDWWLKSGSKFLDSEETQIEPAETFTARNTCDQYCDVSSPKVLPLSQVIQKLEECFPAKLKRSRTPRLADKLRSEIEKDKRGELVKSLFHSGWKMKITCEPLTNKTVHMKVESCTDEKDDYMTVAQWVRSRKKYSDAEKTGGDDASEPFGKRARSNDSDPCKTLASIKIEQMSEDKTIQICDDDKVDVNEGNAEKKAVIDDVTASKAHKTMQICDDDDGGNNAEKKSKIDEEPSNEKLCSEAEKKDVDERLKQRKLAIEEIALKLEARIMKVKKTLAEIRKWKTSRNQIINGVCA